MKPEEHVQQALRALAEHDRGLESRLPAPAMPRHWKPISKWPILKWPISKWKTGAGYTAVLAAAAALVLYLQPRAEAPVEPPKPVQMAVTAAPAVEAKPAPAPKPARRAKKQIPIVEPEVPVEVVTEFFPLMEAPPPFERGRLLRVMVPASTLRTVGLPVNPERWSQQIPADLLVGEEGMPRAIRFVSFER